MKTVRTEKMNKLALFAMLASVMLLTQVIPAHAGDSEARKKAKEREEQIAKEIKEKKKGVLNAQKKALDPVTTKTTTKVPKGKAAAESTNVSRLAKLNNAKAAYESAKTSFDSAKKALKSDSTNSTKQQNYNNAKIALEKAKVEKELAKLE